MEIRGEDVKHVLRTLDFLKVLKNRYSGINREIWISDLTVAPDCFGAQFTSLVWSF